MAEKFLASCIVANLLSTAIHYFDNYVSYALYPMPTWITPDAVWIAWVALTAIGSVGCWLYRQRLFAWAYGCLALYALTGASTPGHYWYAPLSHFSPKMNAMIWSDGIAGLLLIAFVLWSIFVDRPWQTATPSN